ncbi:hypothetical protein XENTR_v10013994 [Xenopus tropicalis]|nr:hypothetical protein XENTR_v10013994 [Xenopus tropicalis]
MSELTCPWGAPLVLKMHKSFYGVFKKLIRKGSSSQDFMVRDHRPFPLFANNERNFKIQKIVTVVQNNYQNFEDQSVLLQIVQNNFTHTDREWKFS